MIDYFSLIQARNASEYAREEIDFVLYWSKALRAKAEEQFPPAWKNEFKHCEACNKKQPLAEFMQPWHKNCARANRLAQARIARNRATRTVMSTTPELEENVATFNIPLHIDALKRYQSLPMEEQLQIIRRVQKMSWHEAKELVLTLARNAGDEGLEVLSMIAAHPETWGRLFLASLFLWSEEKLVLEQSPLTNKVHIYANL